MENSPEFVSYKKVLVFGATGTGKTTLSKYIEKGKFTEETQSENGKKYIFNFSFINSRRNNESFKRNGEFKIFRFKFI